MKKLLLLLILSASTFASAQEMAELTYTEPENILNVNNVPYELFGEPDRLWGDVVRRSYVATTRNFIPRPMVRDGRTFTVVIDQYGLQPQRQYINYGKANEWRITAGGLQGVTTIEMTPSVSGLIAVFTAEFTVPSEGTYDIWYTGSAGAETFTVE